MWPFSKCNHPFRYLWVETKETVEIIDVEFEDVTYHFHCHRCGKLIDKGYSRLRISVSDFMAGTYSDDPEIKRMLEAYKNK